MQKLTLQHLIDGAGGVAIPSWADAESMLTLFGLESTDVALDVPPAQQILPADPMRWAVGFIGSTAGLPIDLRVAPWNDPSAFGLGLSTTAITWVRVFESGPLPTFAWFGQASVPTPVRILSITYRG